MADLKLNEMEREQARLNQIAEALTEPVAVSYTHLRAHET